MCIGSGCKVNQAGFNIISDDVYLLYIRLDVHVLVLACSVMCVNWNDDPDVLPAL